MDSQMDTDTDIDVDPDASNTIGDLQQSATRCAGMLVPAVVVAPAGGQ